MKFLLDFPLVVLFFVTYGFFGDTPQQFIERINSLA